MMKINNEDDMDYEYDDMTYIINLISGKITKTPEEFIDNEQCLDAVNNKVSSKIIEKLNNNNVGMYFYMFSNTKNLNNEFYEALKNNWSLHTLYLCINSNFNINSLSNVFKLGLTNINVLNLSRNSLKNIDDLCNGLMNNHTLTHLNLKRNNISNIKVLCDYLYDNKTLEFLDLSYNNIIYIDDFKDVLIKNKTLKDLNIGYNDICINEDKIKGSGIIKFCEGLKKNNSLRSLNLENIGLYDITPLFDSLRENISLTSLNLNLNDKLNNLDCLEEFFKENKGLIKLSLKNTNITDIKKMCEGLKYNSTLYYLNLKLNNLYDDQLTYLADALDQNITLETVLYD